MFKPRRSIDPVPIDLNIIVLIIDDNENLRWSLLGISNLKERMRMLNSSLALLTEIEVVAHSTFITDSSKVVFVAVITSNIFVDSFLRLFSDDGFFFFFSFEELRVAGLCWFFILGNQRLIGDS
jgi:hypothetical protein